MEPSWLRAASLVGVTPNPRQVDLLQRFGRWLGEEAVPAGGLGPSERDRIESRHLADSIVFALEFSDETERVADVGSGVGLPGIPLAILFPEIYFTLIDRSGRRSSLARRAIRVLGLSNVEVLEVDVAAVVDTFDVVVARAFASPAQIGELVGHIVKPGGLVVIGGSTQRPPRHEGWRSREIPQDVLDHSAWLLMMRPQ